MLTAIVCVVFAGAMLSAVLTLCWVLYRSHLDNLRIEAKEAELRQMQRELWRVL